MPEFPPLSTPAPFPLKAVRRISFLVRVCCALAFVIGSLMPIYVPQAASDADSASYLAEEQFLLVEEGFVMKTASISEQGHRLAYSRAISHTVGEAENLSSIADLYGISLDTIRWANDMKDGQVIHPGDTLIILPVDGVLHTVRRGQTLGRIAQLYDIPVDAIIRQNNIRGGFIVAGQQLIIPGGKPITAPSVAAAGEQALQFADALPAKDIKLPLPGGRSGGAIVQAPAVSAALSQTLLQMPCENCFYTQKYHPGHYAVDIQTRGGGPIFAAEAGTVIRADVGWNGGYGNVIEIDHGNGLVTLYGHNKLLYVHAGETIQRGQVIAEMGNTGLVHGPTGIHVHFEVHVSGVKRNPILYLE